MVIFNQGATKPAIELEDVIVEELLDAPQYGLYEAAIKVKEICLVMQ